MAKETSKEPEGKIDYSLLAIYSNKTKTKAKTKVEETDDIGFAPESSAARDVLKSPDFPSPIAFAENGWPKYFRKDLDDWLEKRRQENARKAIEQATCARSILSN